MGQYAQRHSSVDEEALSLSRLSSEMEGSLEATERRQLSMEANGGSAHRHTPAVRVLSSLIQGDMGAQIDEELPVEEATPLDNCNGNCLQEGDDEKKPRERFGTLRSSRMWKFEKYELPQSTYTFLITEHLVSKPYCMATIALCLSAMSLSIVLINELNNGTANSPYGLPAGVPIEVRIAQYLGIIIGVLMEEEVPLGLEILGKCVEAKMFDREPFQMWKVVLSSVLRLSIGYLFLSCLFFTVCQENDVLDIFFDVLACKRNLSCFFPCFLSAKHFLLSVEFVENIDDVLYALSRRGFFGKTLKRASYETHAYDPPGDSRTQTFAKWFKRFVRFVYFGNGVLMLFGLTYLMIKQDRGDFRCKSITVTFSDEVWEDSWIKRDDGTYDMRLLVYSHFNGIYAENGTHDGRPRYYEQNKEDGDPFVHTIGAEIVYCAELEAWVFRHEMISTSPRDEDEENECSWLLRSPETESFDIIEVAQEQNRWMIWEGRIEQEYSITITCNECYDEAGCNYHGDCVDQMCFCDDELYFGSHCEFDRPCEVIRSEKDANTTLHLVHDNADDMVHFVEVYGHPKYVAEHMSGIPHNLMKLKPTDDSFSDDDFFEIHTEMEPFQQLLTNYTFVLRYTGRRWLGQIAPNGVHDVGFNEEEYHAYWDNTFSGLGVDDNATVIISAPTSHASPVGVDFYEMRRRNKEFEDGAFDYDYSPFGVLIPSIGAEGAGYFHCNKDE
ncbi:hypothetical protein ACHAXT_001550 [Thalassiosira profunda]